MEKILNLENTPLHGSLILKGLDRTAWHTIQWRQKIVYVPQFHSNYIFTASFAYNMLMADQWPASQEKFERLYALCVDLGLGDLLKAMPEGIWQRERHRQHAKHIGAYHLMRRRSSAYRV